MNSHAITDITQFACCSVYIHTYIIRIVKTVQQTPLFLPQLLRQGFPVHCTFSLHACVFGHFPVHCTFSLHAFVRPFPSPLYLQLACMCSAISQSTVPSACMHVCSAISQSTVPSACMHVFAIQSCLTFCYPVGCSPPDSPIHGIFQTRTLEQAAISYSRNLPLTAE